jgi:hypothetical protein
MNRASDDQKHSTPNKTFFFGKDKLFFFLRI